MPAAMQGGAASHSVASFPPSMQEWPVDGEAPCSAKAAALTAAAPPIEQLQLATRPVAFPTDVKFVRFENCDLRGLSTGVLILRGHAARFASLGRPLFAGLGAFAANGGIPRSLPFQTSCPNARLFPCAGTVRRLPHQPTVARVLCELCASDLRHDGGVGPTAKGLGPGPDRGDPKAPQPLQIDPRAACRRQLARLRALGLCLLSSFEMEFFLLEMRGDDLSTVRPAGIDSSFARTASLFELHPFIEKATDVLAALGVNLEAVGKEHPAGQLEFIPAPSFGVRAADDAFTIRNSVKEVARMEGKYATFMSNVFPHGLSSGCHLNQSLWHAGKLPAAVAEDGGAAEPRGGGRPHLEGQRGPSNGGSGEPRLGAPSSLGASTGGCPQPPPAAPQEEAVPCVCHSAGAGHPVPASASASGDPSHPTGLSKVARSFIAGQLAHWAGLCRVLVPDMNAARRIKAEAFVPLTASWALESRKVAIRVKAPWPSPSPSAPRLKAEAAGGLPSASSSAPSGPNPQAAPVPSLCGSAYWENRLGASSINPYLAIAATVAAGIDGIERDLELPSMDAAAPEISARLEESTPALRSDKVLMEALGEPIVEALEGIAEKERLDRFSRLDGCTQGPDAVVADRDVFIYL
eukprot:GHVT01009636.1.p1 GENE.GHVT01009636.1~~GHVT01009636.1.p1  ORF type:complete len:635 (+),score=169.40 GHVT01009636.1:253-2157(+)